MRRNPGFVAIGLAAVVLAGATVAVTSYGLRSHKVTKAPASALTELPPAPSSSACLDGALPDGPDFFHVSQDMNGYLSGCFRLSTTPAGEYTISLQSGHMKPAAASSKGGAVRLDIAPAVGPPGTKIRISGMLPGGPSGPSTTNDQSLDHAWICFDCPGLEESVDVNWSKGGHFSIASQIPSVPWMGLSEAVPLKPGGVTIGIQCLGSVEITTPGCLGRVQGTATFAVTGPTPRACLANQPCAWLAVTPPAAAPGDVVRVEGWAPLTELIGTPYGYNLHLSTGTGLPSPSPLSEANAVLSFMVPTSFTVKPGRDWASLGTVAAINLQASGDSPIATDRGNPQHLAYCSTNGVAVTWNGGKTWSTIGLARASSVVSALGFQLLAPNIALTACGTLALDSGHPSSLFVRLPVQKRNEGIPPIYSIGLVTTDGGASWSAVPIPSGQRPEQFGGFRNEGGRFKAYFGEVYGNYGANLGKQPVPMVEETSDGGRSWRPSMPTCPSVGACLTFAGVWNDNCAKFPSPEVIVYSLDHGKSWAVPQWPSSLDACGTGELVATGDGAAMAITGRDEFHVLVSHDGGATWTGIVLPVIETDARYDMFEDLKLLPNGSLLGFYGSGWSLLPSVAQGWCTVTGPLAGAGSSGRTQIIGNRLWWITQSGQAVSVSLSALTCS